MWEGWRSKTGDTPGVGGARGRRRGGDTPGVGGLEVGDRRIPWVWWAGGQRQGDPLGVVGWRLANRIILPEQRVQV